MTSAPITLTIAIPTYNRANHLRVLLDSLVAQVAKMNAGRGSIAILVADNASTDDTAQYLSGLAVFDFVTVHRHAQNHGAAANVIHCFRHAMSRYVWIVGDDDLPMPGSLEAVLHYLGSVQPALFYLPPKWVSGDLEHVESLYAERKRARLVSAARLSLKASVHSTFLSSWIVNRDVFLRDYGEAGIDAYSNTVFPQLAWIFGLMRSGSTFLTADEPWLLASAGNSGNYAVFEAFSRQYNGIVDRSLAGTGWLWRFHRHNVLWNFMPGLVWAVRADIAGRFDRFDAAAVEKVLSPAYAESRFFKWIVLPMIRLGPRRAKGYWVLARVVRRIRSGWIAVHMQWRRPTFS